MTSIVQVEVVPYALPFRRPYRTARGFLRRREMALLRIRDAEGVEGLGEAVPLALRGGTGLPQVVAELGRLAERAPADGKAFRAAAAGLSAPARCAALTALADLDARREGPSSHAPVCCNATLVADRPRAVAADALEWAEAGFSTFKLKLGVGEDIAQVRAVREALGPGARIRIDVNAAWDVETAQRTMAELEPYDIELAEQPVAGLAAMAEVAAATSIPLAADESVATPAEAEEARAAGACATVATKLSKVGGAEAALAIAAVLPSYISSALDGPVGIAAAAQVAAVVGPTAPFAHGLATQRLFAATVAASGPRLEGDMLHPAPGPGLGVEIDESALAAHRL